MDIAENTNIKDENICVTRKSNLIKLLDSEINQIMAEQSKPGWNQWVLYGSIAAILWLLLQTTVSKNISFNSVSYYFIIFNFTYVSVVMTLNIFNKNKQVRSSIILTEDLLSNRTSILFEIFFTFIIIGLIFNIDNFVLEDRFLIFSYFMLIIYIAVLVLGLLKLPVPIGGNKSMYFSAIVNAIILLLLLIVPVVLNLNEIIENVIEKHNYNMDNIKLSVLLFALVFLIRLISKSKNENILLYSLIDIRRNLILEKISIDNAFDQTDIAINGMKVSDVFKEDINSFLNSYNKYELTINENIKKISVAKNELITDSKMSSDKKALLKTIIESANNSVDDCFKGLELKKKYKKTSNKIKFLKMVSSSNKNIINELNSILDKFGNIISKFESRNKEFNLEMAQICSLVCENMCERIKKYTEDTPKKY